MTGELSESEQDAREAHANYQDFLDISTTFAQQQHLQAECDFSPNTSVGVGDIDYLADAFRKLKLCHPFCPSIFLVNAISLSNKYVL